MDELDEIIKQINDEFGEGTATTADNINRPEPKQSVKEIDLFNEFNIRNPKAGGGMLVQPGFGGVRQGYKEEARFKQEGLKTRVSDKIRNLIEKKQPINPKTGKVYTMKEYASLTRGQKDKLSSRLRDKFKSKVRSPRLGYYPEKDANKLINFLKIAADKQKNNNVPLKKRTFISVFDKGKFVGVRDVRANTLYTHIDYKGKRKGTSIALHPSQDEVLSFLKEAKKFKFEKPDKLLGSYFSKYERVPTYSEIYNFFNRDRNAPIKSFKQNALEIHHRNLIEKMPDAKFQLVTMRKNTEANRILNALNNKQITKKEADAALKKLGVNIQGMGKKDITTGKSIASAKRETVKLFKDALKENPNIADDIAKKLQIKKQVAVLGGGNCGRIGNYQGGRVGLQDGTPSIDVCYDRATKRINSGFKNATPAEARNYTKLLNAVKGSAVIGKNLLKFGIVPEALYVGADSLIRMGYGDTFKEAGLRAADFFIPGDQMQEADKLKVQRTLGDAAATNVGRVFDYRNQIANINSLEQQKQNFKNLSGGGVFDYVGDLSQDIKNIDTRLNQAKNDLQNKFMVSEAETVAADRALEEAYDASKAKSPITRLKRFAQNIELAQDDPFLSDIASPEKTQTDLNLNLFPTMQTDFMKMTDSDIIRRRRMLKDMGVTDLPSSREIIAGRDEDISRMKKMPLMDAAQQFGAEQVFGSQGTFFGQPLAGGGIAKIAGVDQGPPPESGPNSQGLKGLFNRVKNI